MTSLKLLVDKTEETLTHEETRKVKFENFFRICNIYARHVPMVALALPFIVLNLLCLFVLNLKNTLFLLHHYTVVPRYSRGYVTFITVRGLDWTLVNEMRWLFSNHFWPLFNASFIFTGSWAIANIGSSLEPNNNAFLKPW